MTTPDKDGLWWWEHWPNMVRVTANQAALLDESCDNTEAYIVISLSKEGEWTPVVKPFLSRSKHLSTLNEMLKTVCSFYDVLPSEVLSRSRVDRLAWPRLVLMYLAKLKEFTTIEIGAFLNREHTTISYACRTVANDISTNAERKKEVDGLRKQLGI